MTKDNLTERRHQAVFSALKKRHLRMGSYSKNSPVDEAEAIAFCNVLEADGWSLCSAQQQALLEECAKEIDQLAQALEAVTAEAQAWRDGLNTRAGYKNMNVAKVGCVFVAFGLSQHRQTVTRAKSFLTRLRADHG